MVYFYTDNYEVWDYPLDPGKKGYLFDYQHRNAEEIHMGSIDVLVWWYEAKEDNCGYKKYQWMTYDECHKDIIKNRFGFVSFGLRYSSIGSVAASNGKFGNKE